MAKAMKVSVNRTTCTLYERNKTTEQNITTPINMKTTVNCALPVLHLRYLNYSTIVSNVRHLIILHIAANSPLPLQYIVTASPTFTQPSHPNVTVPTSVTMISKKLFATVRTFLFVWLCYHHSVRVFDRSIVTPKITQYSKMAQQKLP